MCVALCQQIKFLKATNFSRSLSQKWVEADSGVSIFRSCWIAQANAHQRRSRAGRIQPGVCYRLYSCLRFNSMQELPTPEIKTFPLEVIATLFNFCSFAFKIKLTISFCAAFKNNTLTSTSKFEFDAEKNIVRNT